MLVKISSFNHNPVNQHLIKKVILETGGGEHPNNDGKLKSYHTVKSSSRVKQKLLLHSNVIKLTTQEPSDCTVQLYGVL